jgi:hypothetical protein
LEDKISIGASSHALRKTGEPGAKLRSVVAGESCESSEAVPADLGKKLQPVGRAQPLHDLEVLEGQISIGASRHAPRKTGEPGAKLFLS